MRDDATRYQQRLVALGFLAPNQVDGVFGSISMDAFNRYRATQGLPPLRMTTLAELERTLFPKPTLKTFSPSTLDILFMVINLLKGRSMNADVITQLIRIVGYAAGSYFFGDAVAKGDMYQAALGGAAAVASFVWWAIQQRAKPKA